MPISAKRQIVTSFNLVGNGINTFLRFLCEPDALHGDSLSQMLSFLPNLDLLNDFIQVLPLKGDDRYRKTFSCVRLQFSVEVLTV